MLKHLARAAVHRSGVFNLLRRLNQNRVRILMHHRFPQRAAQNFDSQCVFLAANYDVIPLEEAVRRLTAGEPVTNTAVITIDDGYADVHEVALPILRRHRLPATLFVTTGFIDRTCWMPGDRVRFHLAHTTSETIEITDDAGRAHIFRTADPTTSEGLRTLLKRVPERAKRRMLSQLDNDRPVPDAATMPDDFRPCTWDQIRELADGGFSIGAHTVTHPILSRLETAEETEQEILQSKTELEEKLQRPIELFAYPNGTRDDIDQRSIDCVRANFKGAVTAIDGLNPPGADVHNLLRLPCDPAHSVAQLARLMAGPLRRGRVPHLVAHPAF